jgi:hypothetical protein
MTRRLRVPALVACAFAGIVLGCARTTPPENVWFDACCDSCSADVCESCSQAKKGECGSRSPAECLIDNGMMMCRPPPDARK